MASLIDYQPNQLERYDRVQGGDRCQFTVFTSTFNSAGTIHRPYESLLRQTLRDFEWLIVDMGTDDTDTIVSGWQEGPVPFTLRYIRCENRGKHGAINIGAREARGQFFVVLDADDQCVPEALERFKYHWDSIPESKRAHSSGVGSLCRDQTGNLVGTRFPSDVIDVDFLELWHTFKVRGEKWLCIRTDVMREFPFPELPDLRSIPESVVLFRMARKYKTRWVNEVLRVYWVYPDSISRRFDPHAIAGPVRVLHLVRLNEQLDWFCRAPLFYCRSALNYSRFSFHQGIGVTTQIRHLSNFWGKLLWATMLPAGCAIYLRDRWLLSP